MNIEKFATIAVRYERAPNILYLGEQRIDHNVCMVEDTHHHIPTLSLADTIAYCQQWLPYPDTLLLVGHAAFDARLTWPKHLAHPVDVMAIESSLSAYLYCAQVGRSALLCLMLTTAP
jgi:hypothetical protein